MPSAEVTYAVDYGSLDRVIRPQARQWLQTKMTAIASRAFQLAPESTPTPVHPMSSAAEVIPGRLKHSIDTEIEDTADGLIGRVVVRVPYAKFVVLGTAAHPIFPRKAKALAFWWEKKGDFAVLPSVNHPGTAPNRFLLDAFIDVMTGGA